MRRTSVLLLALLGVAAPAHAAALPASTDPGIAVHRDARGAFVFTFTPSAYRAVAGRTVTVSCATTAPRSLPAAPPQRYVIRLRASPKRAPMRLLLPAGTDICSIGDELVALGTRARRFLADHGTALTVGEIVVAVAVRGRSHASWPGYTSLPAAVRARVARLASPGADPRGKAYGYWTNGRRNMVVAGTSATGRRLAFAMSGDDLTTNVPSVTHVLDDARAASGTLPV